MLDGKDVLLMPQTQKMVVRGNPSFSFSFHIINHDRSGWLEGSDLSRLPPSQHFDLEGMKKDTQGALVKES